MSAPAKTQALEALVEAHARELHLPAIRQRFRGLAAEAVREQQTPLAYLAALLEAEVTERSERREKRRLLDARFPIIKRLEDFVRHEALPVRVGCETPPPGCRGSPVKLRAV
jgi:DNA replication protein DnaC